MKDTNNRKNLIGLVGRAGAGKDTVADRLVKEHGYVRVAFADKLKIVVAEAFDVPLNFFNDRDKKNEPHPNICKEHLLEKFGGSSELCNWFRDIAEDVAPGSGSDGSEGMLIFLSDLIPDSSVHALSPRQAAQVIGTEGFRQCFNERVWVDCAMRQAERHLNEGRSVVVTDVRFPDEVQTIKFGLKGCTGGIVGIVRESSERHDHISERFIDDLVEKADAVLNNKGSIADLECAADELKDGLGHLIKQKLLKFGDEVKRRAAVVATLMEVIGGGANIASSSVSFIRDLDKNSGKIAFLSDVQINWLNNLERQFAADPSSEPQPNRNKMK